MLSLNLASQRNHYAAPRQTNLVNILCYWRATAKNSNEFPFDIVVPSNDDLLIHWCQLNELNKTAYFIRKLFSSELLNLHEPLNPIWKMYCFLLTFQFNRDRGLRGDLPLAQNDYLLILMLLDCVSSCRLLVALEIIHSGENAIFRKGTDKLQRTRENTDKPTQGIRLREKSKHALKSNRHPFEQFYTSQYNVLPYALWNCV